MLDPDTPWVPLPWERDAVWLTTLVLVSEAAAGLGDVSRASTLYELALPYRNRNVMMSAGVCLGFVDRYLGILAGVRGRWHDVCRHFETALERNDRMGARTWVAHTQHEYARALLGRNRPGGGVRAAQLLQGCAGLARELGMTTLLAKVETEAGSSPSPGFASGGEAVFCREGDRWTVTFDGRTSRVKDAKGMRYLSRLLAQPEVEIHVLDLVRAESPALAERRSDESALEVLDARAKAAYQRRITDLRAEVEEATRRSRLRNIVQSIVTPSSVEGKWATGPVGGEAMAEHPHVGLLGKLLDDSGGDFRVALCEKDGWPRVDLGDTPRRVSQQP